MTFSPLFLPDYESHEIPVKRFVFQAFSCYYLGPYWMLCHGKIIYSINYDLSSCSNCHLDICQFQQFSWQNTLLIPWVHIAMDLVRSLLSFFIVKIAESTGHLHQSKSFDWEVPNLMTMNDCRAIWSYRRQMKLYYFFRPQDGLNPRS